MAEGDQNGIGKFDCESDSATLGSRWKRWLQSFEFYADGKGLIVEEGVQNKVSQRRRALLLHSAGTAVQDVFSTLPDTGPVNDYSAALEALNKYFVPKINSTYARHAFHKLQQKTGETVRQFATRLSQAAKDCEYGDEKNNQIRDEILSKCLSSYVRQKLLEEGRDLTLTRALEIADQCEEVTSQMAQLAVGNNDGASGTVNRVRVSGKAVYRDSKHPHGQRGKQQNHHYNPKKKKKARCYRCGEIGHYGKDTICKARDQICMKCHNQGHFAKMCKTKSAKIKALREPTLEEDDFAFVINDRKNSSMLTTCVGGVKLDLLVDSGATSNVIDEATWEKLKAKKIKCISTTATNKKKLYAYASKQPLDVKGTFTCTVQAGSQEVEAEFTVIKGKGVPLLGNTTATELGVLNVGIDVAAVGDRQQSWIEQYPEVFNGVGKLNTHQVNIHIDPKVEPVAQPLRRIPFNMREKVEGKIQHLLEKDIIEPVEGPTPWVNPVVIVPKPGGDIRMCLDMRRANEAIIRGRHPIPTVDELLQSMNGSNVYSKLDLRDAYHQLELTPESRDITTFATHTGLFRYKRLLFGVSSASELSSTLSGIPGVENISDDIIVHGPDRDTHDGRVRDVLERLRACGLTLNREKCQFGMDRLVFMGILLSEKGIGPTEERVKVITQAREPESVSEVRSLLGLFNFCSRFIPQYSTISEPLRKLTRKDVPFHFGPEQKTAFQTLKDRLANAGTLAFFDKKAPTKVIADASPVGLGTVLVQEQNGASVPVHYASRSLTDSERRYSQTEREALALVWACEKLHAYVYGMKFDLVTDHKPLEIIYGPRSKPCARIERWVLRLQPYQFQVVHVPGKQNIADPLSRLMDKKTLTKSEKPEHAHGAEDYVRFVAVSATPNALTTREIEEASANDEELSLVRQAIQTGRFDMVKSYAPIAGELCTVGQLVLRGTRIVMPNKLRPRTIALAHEGHLGIVGTKSNLRTKVWWPGIDKAAEKYCRTCHGCQLVSRPDKPEPVEPTPLPDGPWRDLAVDLMGPLPSGHSLLVIVDYFSRYYDVHILRSTTTDKVIDCLEETFSRHGLPWTVKSDNGPQFISAEFRDYCVSNGITHCKVTAKWAQANGEVERQNASLLKRLKIAQAEGKSWKEEMRKYLMQYRALPHTVTGRSPAELLFNRKMRTKLPDISISTGTDQEVIDRDAEQKGKSKQYADDRRGARYSTVDIGDQVLLKQEKTNKLSTTFENVPYTVVSKAGSNITVEGPSGVTYNRNSSHVKKYARDTDSGLENSPSATVQQPEMETGDQTRAEQTARADQMSSAEQTTRPEIADPGGTTVNSPRGNTMTLSWESD